MARPSTAATRNLSLTEELEKLEQSITLTLQEIDSNFAKAHGVVTRSILPIVERYARNSEAVWDGSKFWKQFFEASANVSLSNYAEAAIEDSSMNQDIEGSHTENESRSEESLHTSPSRAYEDEDDITITTPGRNRGSDDDDDPLLTSPSIPHNHSTPRMPGSATGKMKAKGREDTVTKISDVPSPYEKLRQEMRGGKAPAHGNAPITPGKRPPALPDMSMTPGSSPFDMPESTFKSAANKDAILHQGILGRTYRVAATPMTARRTQILDTAMSSPDEPEPQLRMEYFSSPMKSPLKPGYTVQTPGRKEAVERQRAERRRSSKGVQNDTRELDFGEATRGRSGYTARSMLEWASDDDEIPEMSPPKTIHFGLGGNPLIQTPAREASRQIVDDLLFSAGGDINDVEPEEYSPSVIMKGHQFQDDTF